MGLGEKLFEEAGKITAFKVIKVHPFEGTTTEVTFRSDIRGIGRFPNGKNVASGTMTKYPHGIIDAAWQGTLTTEHGEEFMWWGHEKSGVLKDGKIRGLNIVTGFTNSENLSWMNKLIIVVELAASVYSDEFCATAYEWSIAAG
ncbi:MAG: hypothetical protein EHM25_10260 [Nitrosopumilales archaeon]|jgi:hypothetical protein|nr:MAG: hypothetical protein EHM34_00030 [Nitrosopumilales archaeon]RPJ28242.1 MAG: hypothetical protein EHM25_10260 [Nitrosopumilales archaeon]